MVAVGIDLGTTRSSIAYFDGKKPVIIPDVFGEPFVSSKVILTADGRFYVGRDAENHVERYESHHFTVGSIKRMIDKTDGFILNGKRHYPQIISALILADLKRRAESFLKTKIDEAVICIPCNFGVIQRCATIEAAEIAGFKTLRILNEATAAALAYTFSSADYYEGKELIFDLGGGTLDLSLIDYAQGIIEVKQIEGEEFLGGDDFDERIIHYIVEATKRIHGFDPIEDQPWEWHHIAKLRLKEAAERAKIELSSQSKTRIYVPYIRNILGKTQHVDLELTDQKFTALCEDLISKVLQLVEKISPAVQDNYRVVERQIRRMVAQRRRLRDKLLFRKPQEKEVSETIKDKQYIMPKIVFTGGASKMKCLRSQIESKYKGLNFISRDKELVALGAAIQAGIIKGLTKDWLILDCTAKSIGIGLKDDKYEIIFPKHTTVPSLKKETYTTTVDNQRHISLQIYEGNQEKASLNRKTIDLEFGPLLGAKAGVPKIEVCFEIDAGHVLYVKATDLGSGKTIKEIGGASSYTKLDSNLKNKMKELIEGWVSKETNR